MRFCTLLLIAAFALPASAQNWVDDWLQRVSATQAEQPHWITPVVTVTPRLEQEIRYDFIHQIGSDGLATTNIGGGKGLELIPQHNVELIFNIPPYLMHENPKTIDGFGDVSFLMKYRIAAGNEEHGSYILTAFFAGSIPTGSYKNGARSATVTPTIAGGKGFHRLDIQATFGSGLPVNDTQLIGRTLLTNVTAQYHVSRYFWPEVESNSTFWYGGLNDGRKQSFITPGLVLGRFPIHHRVGLTLGTGFQIAVTSFHQYNHAFVGTVRMPF
jgi:hypothetical protein